MCTPDGQGSLFFSPFFVLSSLFPFQHDVTVGIRISSIFLAIFEDHIPPHPTAADVKLRMHTGSRDILDTKYRFTFLPGHLHKSSTISHAYSAACRLDLLFFPFFHTLSPPLPCVCSRILTCILQDMQLPPSKVASPPNTSILLPHKKKNMRSNATAKPSTTSTTSGPSTPSPSIPLSTPSLRRVLMEPCRSGMTRSRRG